MFQGPEGIFTTLTLGLSRRRLENARLPANKLVQRMRACRDSTCTKGSIPAAASSSIRTSSTVKPGPVNKLR